MQHLFFAFPGGLPGLGLLLLRVAVGLTAVYEGQSLHPLQTLPAYVPWLLAAAGMLAIASILIGFLTPIGCLLLLLDTLTALALRSPGYSGCTAGRLMSIDFIVITSVCAAVGPGAFSLDARLFGRREIIFPR